jgi:hypothetical protein
MNAQTALKEAIGLSKRLAKAKQFKWFEWGSQYHAEEMIMGLEAILKRYEHEAARIAKYRPPKKPERRSLY